MAANNSPREQGKEVGKLMELFKGRFSRKEAEVLLASQGSVKDAALFVMKGDPDEVRRMIHDRDDTLVASLQHSSEEVAAALDSGIEFSTRLFACGDCDHYWWKRVPARKEVSKCRRCENKFSPVPRYQEWGVAEFKCQCGNVFRGSGTMNVTQSPCYKCHSLVMPTRITPPNRRRQRARGDTPHSCTGRNCYNCCNKAEACYSASNWSGIGVNFGIARMLARP